MSSSILTYWNAGGRIKIQIKSGELFEWKMYNKSIFDRLIDIKLMRPNTIEWQCRSTIIFHYIVFAKSRFCSHIFFEEDGGGELA